MPTPNAQVDEAIEDVEESEETTPATYSITSYGADFDVDGLVKRLRRDDIVVPSFQRGFVWTLPQASRFVESLLLGLPVPGIFLSKDDDSQRLLVVDGQQRLSTMKFFYEGLMKGREFKLVKVAPQFEGLTYKGLVEESRRRLDDAIIHATIIKQESPEEEDSSSIYNIFERLNTGGTPLQPQEIRACIYRGELNDLLKELNNVEQWRVVYGSPNSRMKDQELILRFFALLYCDADYHRPMKAFLNHFMHSKRRLQTDERRSMEACFKRTIESVCKALVPRAFRPAAALNAAVYDAVMVGLARRLEQGAAPTPESVARAYASLLGDDAFKDAYTKSTADEENVAKRIRLATEAFATT